MPSSARCSGRQAAALTIVMLWLVGCARVGSEGAAFCPPVVEYSAADQNRAAVEAEALEADAIVVRMLSDYAVLREQAPLCSRVR